MKKLLIPLLLLIVVLSGCDPTDDTIDELSGEGIDLTTLPYYDYLSESNPVITITIKDMGVMKLQLFTEVAKNTVDNMIEYIIDEDYTGSTFHRVIENFMIQGGIVSETNCPIVGEFASNNISNDLSHSRGVLSVARTSVKNSGTSQFFIMHVDYPFLDGDYAAFGGLIDGFNVLDYIAGVNTNYNDAPLETVVIYSMTVELNGYVVIDPVCAN